MPSQSQQQSNCLRKISRKVQQTRTKTVSYGSGAAINSRTNKKSCRPLLILQSGSTPTISPQPRRSPIHHKTRRNQQKPKRQTTNPQNLLAPAIPPGTLKGRRNPGSLIRNTIKATNSNIKLIPYKSTSIVIKRSNPKPKQSAQHAAKKVIATQGACVFRFNLANTAGSNPSCAIARGNRE